MSLVGYFRAGDASRRRMKHHLLATGASRATFSSSSDYALQLERKVFFLAFRRRATRPEPSWAAVGTNFSIRRFVGTTNTANLVRSIKTAKQQQLGYVMVTS